MELTNYQIDNVTNALTRFNPPDVPGKTTTRLARNLRKFKSAWDDIQHDRVRLAASVVADQNKTNQNGQLLLSAAEQKQFEGKWEELLAEKQDVEVHQIELYFSDDDETPKDPKHAIDRSKTSISPDILSALIDVVLVETTAEPSTT